MRTLFEHVWSDWRIGFAIVTVLATGAGFISAGLTPRGPATTFQALWSLALALILGLTTGLVMGSR